MRKLFLALITGVIIPTVYAERIPAPPPLNKENIVPLQNYLRSIYNNQWNAEVVTASPDGSRRGKAGDIIVRISGSTYQLWVNLDSSTNWGSITITD